MTRNPDSKQERGVPAGKDQPAAQATREQAMSLMWAAADTTWRMFTPPAILVGVGIWTDLKLRTGPWLSVLGAVLGLTASIFLVKRQLGAAK